MLLYNYISLYKQIRQTCSTTIVNTRRRVSSVVEHSSANLKVPGSIPGPVSYRGHGYDEACFMHLTPGVVHNFPKSVGV